MTTIRTTHAPSAPDQRPLLARVLLTPFSGRTLREGLYALLNLPLGITGFLLAFSGLAVSLSMLILVVGLPLLGFVLVLLRQWGRLERARARLLLRHDVAEPEPLRPRQRPGDPNVQNTALAWLGALLRSNVSWRSAAYALLHGWWGLCTFTIMCVLWAGGLGLLTYPVWYWPLRASGDVDGIGINTDGEGGGWVWDSPLELLLAAVLGLLLLYLAAPVIRGMAQVDRVLVSGLLGPSAAASRVRQLESDRSQVVDTTQADLRRIERDLHDGAQARLVALAMELGLAKEKLAEDPEAAAKMVEEAHGEVKLALQELRDLARGIHPAVLTDRGLGPALSAVAARCGVPVTVDVELDERPAEAIEGIAYFTVSELLQNVSKHAQATRAAVEVWRADNRLMLQVTDDGVGGADPSAGSGLAGLSERLAAVLLAVRSPVGGPTTLTAELPWRDREAARR
jgi:signal transduction histidine kinase